MNNSKGEKSKENKTGYKKPPKHTQFKKGQTGNPKGRKKKKTNEYKLSDPDEIFAEVLGEYVSVNVEGKKKLLTKQRVIISQLTNKAMQGNMTAIKLLVERIYSLPHQYKDPQASFYRHTEEDQKMFATFFEHAESWPEEEKLLAAEKAKAAEQELKDSLKHAGDSSDQAKPSAPPAS